MDPATAAAYHDSLGRALAAGSAVLKRNGKALDAVEAAVEVLEDDPLFNAGRGAAFAADGTNEMDAALMDGATLAAGSVAAVHSTRHPIALARAVMERTPYVMMVGTGADAFARAQGIEQKPPSLLLYRDALAGICLDHARKWACGATAASGCASRRSKAYWRTRDGSAHLRASFRNCRRSGAG